MPYEQNPLESLALGTLLPKVPRIGAGAGAGAGAGTSTSGRDFMDADLRT